jgi:hypothetical protein
MAKAYSDSEFELGADDYFDYDEIESVRTALAYMLLENTEMDLDTVYSLIFHKGKKINWH